MNQIVKPADMTVRVRRGAWEGIGHVLCHGVGEQYHQGVLEIDDGDVHDQANPVRAAIEGYEIVSAPPQAMDLLWAAGYRMKGMKH